MVNRYDQHMELMIRNLKDLGLTPANVSAATRALIFTDEHPEASVGKMFEDDWED